jgi:hypothetical protein
MNNSAGGRDASTPVGRTADQQSAGLSGPAWIWAESAEDFVRQVASLMHSSDEGYEALGDWDEDRDCVNALILRARQIRDQPLRQVLADALATAPPPESSAGQPSEGGEHDR